MIVGRCDLAGNPLFDDGDEVLIEDASGMPVEIVVADQTGTFTDYRSDLKPFAAEYAGPVNRRIPFVAATREAFAEAYLEAFVGRFSRIQEEYRKRRKAFDTLFKYIPPATAAASPSLGKGARPPRSNRPARAGRTDPRAGHPGVASVRKEEREKGKGERRERRILEVP